jgi:hypothetical protein
VRPVRARLLLLLLLQQLVVVVVGHAIHLLTTTSQSAIKLTAILRRHSFNRHHGRRRDVICQAVRRFLNQPDPSRQLNVSAAWRPARRTSTQSTLMCIVVFLWPSRSQLVSSRSDYRLCPAHPSTAYTYSLQAKISPAAMHARLLSESQKTRRRLGQRPAVSCRRRSRTDDGC